MHEYDIALKVLLQGATDSIIRQITGVSVDRWLNAEMPQVQTSRADLLGEMPGGKLVHLELQSSNDPDMALRMAEYGLRIYRQFRIFPKQIVLYVGERPMRMMASWREFDAPNSDFEFQYTLIDIRDLDANALLASARIEDNLFAILTRLQDGAATVRQILTRIAQLEEPARRDALASFLIISGLRRLAPTIREEAEKMPILNDIMDHEVIGPAIRQGLQKGLEQGLQEGRREGLQEGRYEMLRRLLEKRFGPLPASVGSRLVNLSPSELDEVAVKVLDVSRLEDLFPEKQ